MLQFGATASGQGVKGTGFYPGGLGRTIMYNSLPETLRTRSRKELVPLLPALEGQLDFGNGQFLSLRELLDRAEKTFQTRIEWDRRLSDGQIFVKGSFTLERLISALKIICRVDDVKVQPGETAQEVARRNGQMLQKVLDKMEIDDELKQMLKYLLETNQSGLSQKDLMDRFPNSAKFLERMKDGDQAYFMVEVVMSVFGEGDHPRKDGSVWSNITSYGIGSASSAKIIK